MADELTISGSGSVAVATDELFASAERLLALADEIGALTRHVATIDGTVDAATLPPASASLAVAALAHLDDARAALQQAELVARVVEAALTASARGYGLVEDAVQATTTHVAGFIAGVLGKVLPALVLRLAGPVGWGVLGGIALAALFNPGGAQRVGGRLASGIAESEAFRRVLGTEQAADVARTIAMSVDEFALAASGAPTWLSDLVGEDGLGIVGIGWSAGTAMGIGALGGLFRETPVRLVGSERAPAADPPSGFVERLDRIPDTDQTNGAQVRIERYSVPGEQDRFEVYVAGTVTFSPVANSEPFDMTTNMANARGEGSGAFRAVADAMERAGVTAETPVQLTGYSQGAGTVAQLAASGDYTVHGIAAFGGPTGQVELPEAVPTVIVEHEDDLVPALGGVQENTHAVIVERSVFGGREVPTDRPVPAHYYEHYRETAALMDDAGSDRIAGAAATLDSFTAGATPVASTVYRFERVPDPRPE